MSVLYLIFIMTRTAYTLSVLYCRELLGDNLVFMNLSMGKEDKMKRLLARHGGDEQTASMFDVSFLFVLTLFQFPLFAGL